MLRIFQEEKLVTIGMLSFLVISIVCRVLLAVLYGRMILETDNIATTRNKLLRQCKLKFENCYRLNHGVANISIFVDKFVHRLSFGGLSFEGMYHLSGQTMLLSILIAGVGICKSLSVGRTLGDVLPLYLLCVLELYVFFSISSLVDVKGRKRLLKINLVDYLENHLSARMDVTQEDIQMLYGTERNNRNKQRSVDYMPISSRTVPQKEEEAFVSKINAEELESLLQELLSIS